MLNPVSSVDQPQCKAFCGHAGQFDLATARHVTFLIEFVLQEARADTLALAFRDCHNREQSDKLALKASWR